MINRWQIDISFVPDLPKWSTINKKHQLLSALVMFKTITQIIQLQWEGLLLFRAPLKRGELNFHFPEGKEEWKRLKPGKKMQEWMSKIFIFPKSPRFMSLDWVGEMDTGLPGGSWVPVAAPQAPAGSITKSSPQQSGWCGYDILVAPNYNEYKGRILRAQKTMNLLTR